MTDFFENIEDKSLNLIIAINPKEIQEFSNDKDYIDWFSEFINTADSKLKENSVIAISGFYGKERPDSDNIVWKAVLSAIHTTNWSIGDILIWKKSKAEEQIYPKLDYKCKPIFILCRKNENRTHTLNVDSLETNSGREGYHTPISNMVCTEGLETDELTEMENRILEFYKPENGTVWFPFNKI